jgi:hypothetical protein
VKIPASLSSEIFELTTEAEVTEWLRRVDKVIQGIVWRPLGGIANNVHTVEVASDPSLALVERPTNSIDQLLDLKAMELRETAPTPHAGARRWWGVPSAGLAELDEAERRRLADLIRVEMYESQKDDRPTIVIQDQGTGQHPDDFPDTLLSLLASNKKSKTHVMGVYNAGGSASYKFAKYGIIASRLAPQLLNGKADEIGISVVRYNPLDPDQFKSGVYEYCVDKEEKILRLDMQELPGLPYGAYIKLIEYLLPKYARAAQEPKNSLWHLFHAALPDPALPFRIIENRVKRFPGLKGSPARRVVSGLLHLLDIKGTADYSDFRPINLGPDVGTVMLRYYVLNEGRDPEYYTTSAQGLTVTLNGQRQITKDRLWLRRHLELFYLYKRLLVFVDCTLLTNTARREVFASTRETGVDSPLGKEILDRVVQEMMDDDNLFELDEAAKQRALQSATKSTTDKIKRKLAGQIASMMAGEISGKKGGGTKSLPKPRRRGTPPVVDDTQMLEIPDLLEIITNPLVIQRGKTGGLRLHINAKNDFLPKYADRLTIVFGPELRDHLQIRSKGRLLGGKMRITVEANSDAPIGSSTLKVALVVYELGVLLTTEGIIQVIEPEVEKARDPDKGGEPNVEVYWYGRERWEEHGWNAESVGNCFIYRDDPLQAGTITKVVFNLNEAFGAFERVVESKKMGEAALKTFREGYEYPVLIGLFQQRLAEDKKEAEADEEGRSYEIPDDYVEGEKARLARSVLMAMEPEIQLAQASEV